VRLTQVFANLLNNAAKYTREGGRIEVSLVTHDGQAVARVTDNGVGIEPEMRGRVFEMFAQIPEEQHRTGQGLGIGLSIVRSLVRQHGGTVAVHSEGRGLGSAFEVCLPLADSPSAGRHARPAEPGVTVARRRVLVVDDNRDAADSIAMVLTTLGADVRVAYDGIAGLERVERDSPDIAFLDIGMPGMDGHELARRIRERPGPGPTLVALTGWGQQAERDATRCSGFDHHLIKPVRIEVLQELLNATPAR
jgi:CheY-like chemotaxis protein